MLLSYYLPFGSRVIEGSLGICNCMSAIEPCDDSTPFILIILQFIITTAQFSGPSTTEHIFVISFFHMFLEQCSVSDLAGSTARENSQEKPGKVYCCFCESLLFISQCC